MLAHDATRAKVWGSTDLGSISPKRLKKLVREGVPNALRHDLWLHLSGATVERERFPPAYFAGIAARCFLQSTATLTTSCWILARQRMGGRGGFLTFLWALLAGFHTLEYLTPFEV